MISALIKHLEVHTTLNEEEKTYLKNNVPIERFKKGHLLLSEGEISKAFYFIIKGSVRLFYKVGIEEKTAYFYFEDSFVSAYESFTKQSASKQYLETLEASEMAIISFETAYELLQLFPKFEFLARVIMEQELIVYQDIISAFVTQNAEKRYVQLLETNHRLIQRIPQHQLASFLGVAPETLSRIRKRIFSK